MNIKKSISDLFRAVCNRIADPFQMGAVVDQALQECGHEATLQQPKAP